MAYRGNALRLQILRDEFDSQLKLLAFFDIYTAWLLTERTQAYLAVSLNYS